jgi:hypothetical protein
MTATFDALVHLCGAIEDFVHAGCGEQHDDFDNVRGADVVWDVAVAAQFSHAIWPRFALPERGLARTGHRHGRANDEAHRPLGAATISSPATVAGRRPGASLRNTLRLNDVDPFVWLNNVLEKIVSGQGKANDLPGLRVWNWKAERAEQPAAA